MLLQSRSSMSPPSLACPWFITDKVCQCALPLFAAVQNIRNNPVIWLQRCLSWQIWHSSQWMCFDTHKVSSWHVNLYISISLKSPLLHCHCSSLTLHLMSHIFSVSMPSPFYLFRCFPIPSEPVLLPPILKTFLHIHSTQATDSIINHLSTCAKTEIGYWDNLSMTWTITHNQIWQCSNIRH